MHHVKLSDPTARVLFLGNNDDSTDQLVTILSKKYRTNNHGLVSDSTFEPLIPGFYHTTIVDVPFGSLLVLAQKFDLIVMLDQPQSQWSHWKCFQATFKLMLKLEELDKSTEFRGNKNITKILYWHDLIYKNNKSFCIYPWVTFVDDGDRLKLCSRDGPGISPKRDFVNWTTDPAYTRIRNKMIQGELLPGHCNTCYNYEAHNIESYRQFESMDWVVPLELENIQDLARLQKPYFYEVHAGNHCNIKCRGCQPSKSAPIGKEIKKFNIKVPFHMGWEPAASSIDTIDIDTLDEKTSVYFQGGEPTIMPEVLDFMKQCIVKNKTDFFLTMATNGVKFSDEFLETIAHFSNTNFSFSLDGYQKINDYWRSGTNWDKVIANAHMLQELGHSISINSVPGIYNVTNLHLLFEFLDREFPFTSIYLQVNHLPAQSALNHPLKDLVIESMSRCRQTSVYHSNGKSCKSGIDSIYNHYVNNPVCNIKDLQDFFDYNDQLDRVRGTKLADFIPELEAARSYIAKHK